MRELQEVRQALETTRLLTLTGTGGTGKTRLAIAGANAVLDAYPGGVWLVELAAVRQPALVARALGDVLGIREPRGTTLVERIAAHIDQRRVLIVLDNCEHLVHASAALAGELLAACPQLRILATSRQPLRVPGEVIFRVPSLPVPDPGAASTAADVASIDSVRLFSDRALAVDPSFAITGDNVAAVAGLCFHLDGLPLAIELAASRVAAIPLATLAERLDQRFTLLVGGSRTALTRQQTLEATLDWSYDLLTGSSNAFFALCRSSLDRHRQRRSSRCARARRSIGETSCRSWPTWSTSRWWYSTTPPTRRAIGCWKRYVNTRTASSAP